MLYDALLTEPEKALRDEVRNLCAMKCRQTSCGPWTGKRSPFPHDFIAKLAKHGLRGLRFPRKWEGGNCPGPQRSWPRGSGVLGVALMCLRDELHCGRGAQRLWQ